MLSEKLVIDPDRYKGHSFWRRFVNLNSVTLISTLNQSSEEKVCFRGLGMPLAEEAPHFLLTCAANSPLYKNISQWGEFVVNYPGRQLLEILHFWLLNFPGELVEPGEVGLHMESSERVQPGRIKECHAHLECKLEREMYHQGQIIIMGKILAGCLDQKLAGSSGEIGLSGNLTAEMVGYIFPFGYSLIDGVDFVLDKP